MFWGIDSSEVSYDALFGSSWGVCVVGMVFALPVVFMRIHDTEVEAKEQIGAAVGSVEKSEPEKAAV